MKRKKVRPVICRNPTGRVSDSQEAVAEYLTAVFAENDPALLAAALGDIARARGMSDIAKSTGLAREALYKALRPGLSPVRHGISSLRRPRSQAGRSTSELSQPGYPGFTRESHARLSLPVSD